MGGLKHQDVEENDFVLVEAAVMSIAFGMGAAID